MKTFRLIKLAVMAIMVSVNLSSCSKDDDPTKNDDGIVIGEKKLVQVTELNLASEENSSKTFDFSYDSEGRLISITRTYSYDDSDIRTANYIWGNNIIVERTEDDNTSFNLENNLVKKIQESDDDIVSFSYNSSNQLISKQIDHEYGSTWTNKYVWDKDRFVSYKYDTQYETQYTYSGKTCKGYNPLIFPNDFSEGYDLFIAHPELNGMRSQQLPDKETNNYSDGETHVVDYLYTFDKEGYLETCTMNITNQYNSNVSTWKIIYTFKWE